LIVIASFTYAVNKSAPVIIPLLAVADGLTLSAAVQVMVLAACAVFIVAQIVSIQAGRRIDPQAIDRLDREIDQIQEKLREDVKDLHGRIESKDETLRALIENQSIATGKISNQLSTLLGKLGHGN